MFLMFCLDSIHHSGRFWGKEERYWGDYSSFYRESRKIDTLTIQLLISHNISVVILFSVSIVVSQEHEVTQVRQPYANIIPLWKRTRTNAVHHCPHTQSE